MRLTRIGDIFYVEDVYVCFFPTLTSNYSTLSSANEHYITKYVYNNGSQRIFGRGHQRGIHVKTFWPQIGTNTDESQTHSLQKTEWVQTTTMGQLL